MGAGAALRLWYVQYAEGWCVWPVRTLRRPRGVRVSLGAYARARGGIALVHLVRVRVRVRVKVRGRVRVRVRVTISVRDRVTVRVELIDLWGRKML